MLRTICHYRFTFALAECILFHSSADKHFLANHLTSLLHPALSTSPNFSNYFCHFFLNNFITTLQTTRKMITFCEVKVTIRKSKSHQHKVMEMKRMYTYQIFGFNFNLLSNKKLSKTAANKINIFYFLHFLPRH